MRKVLIWIKKYWKIVIGAILGVAGIIIGIVLGTPKQVISETPLEEDTSLPSEFIYLSTPLEDKIISEATKLTSGVTHKPIPKLSLQPDTTIPDPPSTNDSNIVTEAVEKLKDIEENY